ncbi:UDP-glucuronosyl/UDP-glucosyltransferase [Artemisia annua]|uniref:UDP-glucuronosyl/UDP-glucosyltransferase n=1 Tax=Artemisia annua TaxID=35608 RepID=A0A2U1MAG5_ARTAN|nr:UDP-glucuronosyl/UDP-glucosyltransferase [Artemisia annua]
MINCDPNSGTRPYQPYAKSSQNSTFQRLPYHLRQYRIQPRAPPQIAGPDTLNRHPSFQFEIIPDGLPPPENLDATQDIPSLCKSTSETSLEPFRKLLSTLNSTTMIPRVSCIVSDGSMSFTLDASDELGLPNVIFWTPSACGFLAYVHYDTLKQKGYFPLKDSSQLTNGYMDTIVDCIPSMKGLRLKDMPSFLRSTDPDEFMVNYVIRETTRTKKASAIILNTFDDLEHDVLNELSSIYPNVYSIGPLNALVRDMENRDLQFLGSSLWKEETECMEWLDSKEPKSVVYVNFGSITVMTPQQLVEFSWGLANSNQTFLWVILPDLVSGDSARVHGDDQGKGVACKLVPSRKSSESRINWRVLDTLRMELNVGEHILWSSNDLLAFLCRAADQLLFDVFFNLLSRFAQHQTSYSTSICKKKLVRYTKLEKLSLQPLASSKTTVKTVMATKKEGEQDDSEGDEKRKHVPRQNVVNFFFTNFPPEWSKVNMYELFSEVGEIAEVYIARKANSESAEHIIETGTGSKAVEGCVDSIPSKIKETYGITIESGMAEKVVTPGDFPAKGESTETHGRDFSHFPARAYKNEILNFESRLGIPDEPVVHAIKEHEMSPSNIGEKEMSPSNIGEKEISSSNIAERVDNIKPKVVDTHTTSFDACTTICALQYCTMWCEYQFSKPKPSYSDLKKIVAYSKTLHPNMSIAEIREGFVKFQSQNYLSPSQISNTKTLDAEDSLEDSDDLTNGYMDTILDCIVPSMDGIRLKDMPTFLRTTDPNDMMVNFVYRETSRAKKASAIILNTFDDLEHDVLHALSLIYPPIYSIGPLHTIPYSKENKDLQLLDSSLWKEETECLEWLDSKEPNLVVYVNFGSITVMTPQQLVEFSWGLANKFLARKHGHAKNLGVSDTDTDTPRTRVRHARAVSHVLFGPDTDLDTARDGFGHGQNRLTIPLLCLSRSKVVNEGVMISRAMIARAIKLTDAMENVGTAALIRQVATKTNDVYGYVKFIFKLMTDTKKISAVSILFEKMPYKLYESTGYIDYDQMKKSVVLFRSKLGVAGASYNPEYKAYQEQVLTNCKKFSQVH